MRKVLEIIGVITLLFLLSMACSYCMLVSISEEQERREEAMK